MNTKRIYCWLIGLVLCCVTVQAQHWQCNIHDYQYDMTVYATLQLDGVPVAASDEYEIAAFCGDECRGVATVETLADGTSYYYLRVRSNASEGETITFKCYNATAQKEISISNTFDFASQAIKGYPSEPVLFKNPLRGDVNGDDKVDIDDLILTVNLVMAMQYNGLSDLNDDGKVDIDDIIAMVNIIMQG